MRAFGDIGYPHIPAHQHRGFAIRAKPITAGEVNDMSRRNVRRTASSVGCYVLNHQILLPRDQQAHYVVIELDTGESISVRERRQASSASGGDNLFSFYI